MSNTFFQSESNPIGTLLKQVPQFPALPEELKTYTTYIGVAAEAVNDLVDQIQGGLSAIGAGVNDPLGQLPEAAQAPIKEILEHVKGLGDKLSEILEAISTTVEGLGAKVVEWYTAACKWWETVQPIIDKIKAIFYPSEPSLSK